MFPGFIINFFMKHCSKKSWRGFTLIEVMVSLFTFLIIMMSLSQIFSQSFAAYKNAKAVQRDVESAQYALNILAKELRTSTIVSSASTPPTVKFYDYSQRTCFEYKIVTNQLTMTKKAVAAPTNSPSADCTGGTWSTVTPIAKPETTGGTLIGRFVVTPSVKTVPKSVGKITVSLEISEGANHTARIQTTASLRDYGFIGL